eukprot:scaffold1034_cov418-Prasinococcus_capsulatus_cf.AAC.39
MSAKVISTTVRDDFWATVNGTFPFAVEFICQHHHMAPWMKNNTHITRCVEGNVVVLPFGLPVPAAARRLFAPEPVYAFACHAIAACCGPVPAQSPQGIPRLTRPDQRLGLAAGASGSRSSTAVI